MQRLERNLLRCDEQFAVERGFGRAPAQRLFGGKARQIGIVVLLGEMREDEIAGASIKAVGIGKIFADGVIRKMAGARKHTLFHDPRIRPDLEHVEIVIRFEQQAIRVTQMDLDQLRHVAEVGDQSHLRTIGAKREADGIRGVVRNGKGVHFDVADAKSLAGLDAFDAAEALLKSVRKGAAKRVHRLFGDKERGFPQAEHLRQAVAMIEMLVGDKDAVEVLDAEFGGSEPGECFAFAESGVHEEAGALGLE